MPSPVAKSVVNGGVAYLLARSPELIEKVSRYDPKIAGEIRIPHTITKLAKKHSGKIAGVVAGGTLISKLPKIKKKVDAGRTGIEINTKDRIKKSKKDKNNK